jgi:hypothetical protein
MKTETLNKIMELLEQDEMIERKDRDLLEALSAMGDSDKIIITRHKSEKRDLESLLYEFDLFEVDDFMSGRNFAVRYGERIADEWQIVERFVWAEMDGLKTTGKQFIRILWWKDPNDHETQSDS